tara:strand:+ start:516 stop:1169 length:654 start_codon:yes stop_codon:yes gene_type:complete
MGEMSEVIEVFVDLIRHHPNHLDQLAEQAYDESDGEFTIDEIREALAEEVRIQPPAIIKSSKVVAKRPQLRAHDSEGKSRKSHYREMEQKTAILGIVDKHPKGISKTAILGLLRKDNGHWRPLITRWIRDMVGDKVIQTDGSRFYPYNVPYQTRESELHRRIYECLGTKKGALLFTEIAQAVKCHGGKTRYLVHQGLKDLEEMGYVECQNRRWLWTR